MKALTMHPDHMRQDRHRWLAILTFLVATASLLLQYVLLIRQLQDAPGPALATVRFFSYFTILSNILVALATGLAASRGDSKPAQFFRRGRVRGGIALYIGVTGTIYVLILRHLWQPQGWQWWADTGLHYAVPVLYLLWWLLGVPHGALRWRDLPRWLAFPLAYLMWILVHGEWIQAWYPYPFIDVLQIGWAQVVRNAFGVMALFVVAGAFLVLLDRVLARARKTT